MYRCIIPSRKCLWLILFHITVGMYVIYNYNIQVYNRTNNEIQTLGRIQTQKKTLIIYRLNIYVFRSRYNDCIILYLYDYIIYLLDKLLTNHFRWYK